MNQTVFSSSAEPKRPPIKVEARVIPDHSGRPGSAAGMENHSLLRNQLTAAVRARCPHWLTGHRQDIVQVAMMAVLTQQEKMKEERQFPPSYLRRVAFTTMVDEIRRRNSRGEVPLETAEAERVLVEDNADPERRYLSREISAGVRGCLERLASPRRTAVTLHLLEYRVLRIADRMGWKAKQAENLVYRGMKDLRDCLRIRGLEP